jgi:mannose-6-phosphate isomerase
MIPEKAACFCYDKRYMAHDFESLRINSLDKSKVFDQAAKLLGDDGFEVIEQDEARPWGFFLSVNEQQAPHFIERFYEGIDLGGIDTSLPLRPKILGIAPYMRLSWQYHHRRNEIWRCLGGNFQILLSHTDAEEEQQLIMPGDTILIPQGMRHRGVGLDHWALVAEIWQHLDKTRPSNEEDIVRLQDDTGRK